MSQENMIHVNPVLQAGAQELLVFEHFVSGGDRIIES